MLARPHMTVASLIVLVGVGVMSGCSSQVPIVDIQTFEDYPQHEKHPLTVALRLNEEYCNYVNDRYQFGLEDGMARNSVFVAQKAFQKVHVTKGEKASVPVDAQAILTPKVVGVDMSAARFTSFDRVDTMVDVEWVLEDMAGNVIWLKTIRGQGTNQIGNVFTVISQTRKRMRLAIQDVFRNSYEAISTSPVIRAYKPRT